MKTVVLVTTLLVLVSQTTCREWGGMRVIMKQSLLDTVSGYLHEYLPHLLGKVSFGEKRFKSLIINDIHLTSTDGLNVTVVIKPHNILRVTAAFKAIHVQANVTINNPRRVLRSPVTIFNFTGASLIANLQIGKGPRGGNIDLATCEASVAEMFLEKDSEEVQTILKALWTISQAKINEYLGNLCPSIHEFISRKYKLFAGSATVLEYGIKFPIDYELTSLNTSNGEIDARAAIGLKGTPLPVYGSRDLQFPDPVQLGHERTKDVEVWIRADLLDILISKYFNIETYITASFNAFTTNRNDTQVITVSKNISVECSNDGIAARLSFNVTLVQRSNTSTNCVVINTTTEAILPFVLTSNNTRFEATPDPTRYSLNTTITAMDIAYTDCGPINPDKERLSYEKQLLQNFTRVFEETYNHQVFFAKMIYDRHNIRPVNLTVKTLKDSLVFTTNMALDDAITTEKTTRTEHKGYTHRRVQYTYSGGLREIFIDGQPAIPTSSTPTSDNSKAVNTTSSTPTSDNSKAVNIVPIISGSVLGVGVFIGIGALVYVYVRRRLIRYHTSTMEEDDSLLDMK